MPRKHAQPSTQKESSPTGVRRPLPPAEPTLPPIILSHLTSLLPFLFAGIPTELLFPLFSSAPVASPQATWTLQAVVAVAFVASRFLLSARKGNPSGSRLGWRTLWVVIGAWKIVSEGLIRVGSKKLLGLGLMPGVICGRVLIEAVPTLALWAWIWESWSSKERKAFLPRWWIPCAYLVSSLPPVSRYVRRMTPLVPECYLLQLHGLLLAAIALFAPRLTFPQQAHVRAPRSPPRTLKAKPPILPAAAPPSLLVRTSAFASLLILAQPTALTSTHCPTSLPHPVLGLTQVSGNSRTLTSRKSTTGWIVVGEQTVPPLTPEQGGMDMTFRYLRADHSLLGGLWVGPSRNEMQARKGPAVEVSEKDVIQRAESIYSTFILQELVRLVKPPPDLPRQSPEQGLIIGLGAGLSARALQNHGVNLTICEIDSAVYELARGFFGVERPAEVVLEDAVEWVRGQKGKGKAFDYIIHDVFTGGSLPSSLFTVEFWQSLKPLLHLSGVLAINFAGSLSSPSSKYILSTLFSTFPHCTAFEDIPTTSSETAKAQLNNPDGIKNLVIFCSKSYFLPIEFREPVQGDYLPSGPSPHIRRLIFSRFRRQEIDLARRFKFDEKDEWGKRERERWMFREGMEKKVEGLQRDEVGMHWEAMGKVLTEEGWATW
ncbi:hypothetical protein JCM11641_004339 [Rhodosporidiobolus odoratus]